MEKLTRRRFLGVTSATAASLWLAGCMPIQPPTPGAGEMSETAATGEPISLLDEATQAKVEQLIGSAMEMSHAPGMFAGIVKDGQIVYAKGFGVAEVAANRPVTTRCMFHLMQTTPTMTAAAVLQLLEQGELDLDEPVTAYLPYFQMQDERYKQITLRHLLTHSAGLPEDYVVDQMLGLTHETSYYDDEALERAVRSLTPVRLSRDPGTGFSWSNWSYEILGDVIAKASGQSYEDYMQEHILAQLGMTHSTFLPREADPEDLAAPYINQGGEAIVSDRATDSREHGPSIGLWSCAEDLCRWTLANLNRGELDGQRILQPASYDLLWEPEMPTYYGVPWDHVGLGWWVTSPSADERIVFANAEDEGFTSHIRLAPDENIGVVVAGNLWTMDPQSYTERIPQYATNLAYELLYVAKGI